MNWVLKLKALLHDPPNKIWISFGLKKSHEQVADELFNKLIYENLYSDEAIRIADQLASAQSRVVVKPSFMDERKKREYEDASSVSWDEAIFIDNFTEREEKPEVPYYKKIEDLFDELSELEFSSQEERARFFFLFLWRFYPEIFPEISKHPADSRAPNHSIYDHLVQTSAIVSALQKPAFLLFTIGPVQSFISRARKTSDLWAGSYMLSYLIWESMKPIVKEFGPDVVIFPNLLGQPLFDRYLSQEDFNGQAFQSILEDKFQDEFWLIRFINNARTDEKLTIANMPNRFLAVVPLDGNKTWANKSEEAFKYKLKDWANKVTKKINEKQDSNLFSIIKEQLFNYFHIYWVMMPWSNSGYSPCDSLSDYKALFGETELYETVEGIVNHPYYSPANVGSTYSLLLELTERLLGARKSLRNFKQLEQPGEKCHLCGEFKVLDLDWENLSKTRVGSFKNGERLCGVCITKRLFPEIIKEELNLPCEIRFPSTSEMASIGEKRRVLNNQKFIKVFKDVFSKFESKLPSSISVPALRGTSLYEIDGQWLMEESYREEYFKKGYGISDIGKDDFNGIKSVLKCKKCKCYNINPSRYYALLQMDGDNMGRWLKGEFNPSIKKTIHPKVLDTLVGFSEGSDKTALEKILCFKHPTSPSLHQTFSRKLSTFAVERVKEIVEEQNYGKLVYAGGDDVLALLPVEGVLNCAYELQKAFKEVLSPKASMSAGVLIAHHKYPLYLALKEVGDAEKMAKNRYGKNAFCIKLIERSGEPRVTGGSWELIDFVKELICQFRDEKISSNMPYNFADLVIRRGIENKDIAKTELKRTYLRKAEDREFMEELLKTFNLYQFGVEDFSSMLVIARFFAKESRV